MVWKILGLDYVKLRTSGHWVGPGQELISLPHNEYDKAFLVIVHGSMGIGGSIQARWKVLGLAYNRNETRDKWPLGREPDWGWCHLHTNVKLSWLQPMDPRTEWQHTCMLPLMFDLWNFHYKFWSSANRLFDSDVSLMSTISSKKSTTTTVNENKHVLKILSRRIKIIIEKKSQKVN